MDYSHLLTANMQQFSPNDIIKAPHYSEEYDPELINATIRNFSHENMRILLSSSNFKDECTSVEPYYNAKYSSVPLPQEIIELFLHPHYNPLTCSGK